MKNDPALLQAVEKFKVFYKHLAQKKSISEDPSSFDSEAVLNPIFDQAFDTNDLVLLNDIAKVSDFFEHVVEDGLDVSIVKYLEREKVSVDDLINLINRVLQ